MGANQNGWCELPEDEREALDLWKRQDRKRSRRPLTESQATPQ